MSDRPGAEQEGFWAGAFGDAYTARNRGEALLAANTALFATVLSRTQGVRSVLEFGANVGLNLAAIRRLLPAVELAAIEINPRAVESLVAAGGIEVHAMAAQDFAAERTWDLVLTKGFLIHIAPDTLPAVYDRLLASCGRYLAVMEYYNPVPVEVPYRGHAGRLFKRDFAGELLARDPALRLADYGFVYHGDPSFPQDDLTWFLLARDDPESPLPSRKTAGAPVG